jgi:prepilin-type N-terminal cleavage/methylation domain-containing protein
MKQKSLQAAFTLIELLVVISIIAILAGAAMPVYQGVILNGKMASAMSKARQIGLALHMYAGDTGSFPGTKNDYGEPIVSSNDAFRSLIPGYLDTESIFVVPGSKAGATADNKIGTPSQILERGENHWAYVGGLSNSSNSAWPLIADHTDGSGHYTDKENTLGGTWKGTKTVVIHVDGSAATERLLGAGSQRFVPRFDDRTANALNPNYMGDDVRLFEPAR